MTDKELYDYFWKILADEEATKEQKLVMFKARQLWHQLQDNVSETYGKEILPPSNICDTLNPFTVHFTWDNECGDTLGCSVNEKEEVYFCFNSIFFDKDENGRFTTKHDSWKEYLTLPNIKTSEKLMNIFRLYYSEKKNNGY